MDEIQQLRQEVQELRGLVTSFLRSDKFVFNKNIQTLSSSIKLGTNTSTLIGFYNATPIIQRSSSQQAAVGTTAATQTTPWGYASKQQAEDLITLQNELRLALIALGLIKGSS